MWRKVIHHDYTSYGPIVREVIEQDKTSLTITNISSTQQYTQEYYKRLSDDTIIRTIYHYDDLGNLLYISGNIQFKDPYHIKFPKLK